MSHDATAGRIAPPTEGGAGESRALAMVAGLLLAASFGYDLSTPGSPRWAADLAGLALAGLILAYALADGPQREKPWEVRQSSASARQRSIGLLLILLSVVAGAWTARTLWLNAADWKASIPWWATSVLLATVAAFLLDLHRRPAVVERPSSSRRLVVLGALAVGLLALFLRSYRLDAVPPGIFIDETNSALEAVAILRGAPTSPFATGWYETPTGFMYLQAAFIAWLGPTLVALKLPAIIASVATVLGAFFLGRLLFGTAVGLVSALFLAVARWPLIMSRWGWNETVPPLVQVWAMYFLVRGFRNRRHSDFALAGLILGLGMYSYLSIRIVLLAIAAYLLYRACMERTFLRQNAGRLALFALLWALAFLPLAVTYAKSPNTLLNRTNEVTIQRDIERAGGKIDPLVENVRRHLLMFNVAGDRNPRHNVPGRPMLDPLMGALFVIAVVRGAILVRDHRFGLLVLWVPVTLLAGILTVVSEGPQAYRTLSAATAVALLCGELLVTLAARVAGLLTRLGWPRRWATGLAVIGVAGALTWSGWANFQFYFDEYAQDPNVYIGFTPLETAVAKEVVSASDPGSYYLSPRLFYFSPLRYFAAPLFSSPPGRSPTPPFHLVQGLDDLPLQPDQQKDLVLLWGTEWTGMDTLLRGLYPHLSLEQVPARSGGSLYERATIPAQDFVALRGLVATKKGKDGRSDRERVEDPSAPMSGDFLGVQWSGSIIVPKSGIMAVKSADGAAVLLEGRRSETAAFVPKGLHNLEVAQSGEQARAGLQLLWSGEAGASMQRVPAANLYATSRASDHGLLGTYYRSERWDGAPLFQRVDPVILFAWPESEPVQGPFSVSWRGEIEVPEAGSYGFMIDSDDGAKLSLDGQVVGEAMKPDSANFFEIRVNLTPGRHPIRLDYFQRGGSKGINLRWAPPGKPGALVPTEVLYPAPS